MKKLRLVTYANSSTIGLTESAVTVSLYVWVRALGYPQRFSLNFFPYITFLRHIINSSPPIFSSPAAVSPILSPYTPLQL